MNRQQQPLFFFVFFARVISEKGISLQYNNISFMFPIQTIIEKMSLDKKPFHHPS